MHQTQQNPTEHEHLLSVEELARFLGVGRTSAYNLLSAGDIPSIRIGKLRKIRREDVERFLEDRLEGRSTVGSS